MIHLDGDVTFVRSILGGHTAAIRVASVEAEGVHPLPAFILPPPCPFHRAGVWRAWLRRDPGSPPAECHPEPAVVPTVLQNPDPVLHLERGWRTAQQVQRGCKVVVCIHRIRMGIILFCICMGKDLVFSYFVIVNGSLLFVFEINIANFVQQGWNIQ